MRLLHDLLVTVCALSVVLVAHSFTLPKEIMSVRERIVRKRLYYSGTKIGKLQQMIVYRLPMTHRAVKATHVRGLRWFADSVASCPAHSSNTVDGGGKRSGEVNEPEEYCMKKETNNAANSNRDNNMDIDNESG